MNALVLGGNGFIGSQLVTRLIACGHRVRVFDRAPTSNALSSVEYFSGDFATHSDFTSVLDGCDLVFHLISTSLPSASNEDPISDVQGNLISTLRLLDQMKRLGIKRLVFPSSGGTVYGQAQYSPIDESHPTQPIVSYGATKLAIEKFLNIYRNSFGFRPICLRISNPYGPGFRSNAPKGAIGAFLHRVLNDQPIDLWGTGEIRRDYLYIEDLIDAMIAAITYVGDHHVFNISTGKGTSLLEVIDLVQQATGKKVSIQKHESRTFDVQTNILSNQLAQNELRWKPVTPLMQGIEYTTAWLRTKLEIY